MKFDINKVTVCRNCGALLLPELAVEHAEFHKAIVTLTEEVLNINGMVQGINRNVGQLAEIMKDRLTLDLRGN